MTSQRTTPRKTQSRSAVPSEQRTRALRPEDGACVRRRAWLWRLSYFSSVVGVSLCVAFATPVRGCRCTAKAENPDEESRNRDRPGDLPFRHRMHAEQRGKQFGVVRLADGRVAPPSWG